MVTISDEEPEETTPINFFQNSNEKNFSILESSTRLETIGILALLFSAYLIKIAICKLKKRRKQKMNNQSAPNVNLQNLQNGLGILAAAAESLSQAGNVKQANSFQCNTAK